MKSLLISILAVSVLIFGGSTVLAEDSSTSTSGQATTSSSGTYDPTKAACDSLNGASNPVCAASAEDPVTGTNGIITKIANIMAWFAGAIAVIIIMFAGFRLAKSSGDSSKVTQARETIIYALIGLVVVIAARFIVGFVISKL